MGKNSALLDSFPSGQPLHVCLLGLDSAGKTTALYRMKFDQYLNTVPTIGFNCEKIKGNVGRAKGVSFLVWDVGGQEKLRPLWRSYTRCTDGIIFVIDSVDLERMEEAKMELMRTAKCPDNQGTPLLILANKQDLPMAKEPKELEKLLGLHELTLGSIALSVSSGTLSSIDGNSLPDKSLAASSSSSLSSAKNSDHPLKSWHIQPTCAITGEGLHEGLEKLYDLIIRKRKMQKQKKKR